MTVNIFSVKFQVDYRNLFCYNLSVKFENAKKIFKFTEKIFDNVFVSFRTSNTNKLTDRTNIQGFGDTRKELGDVYKFWRRLKFCRKSVYYRGGRDVAEKGKMT